MINVKNILFCSIVLIISRLMPHPPDFGPAMIIALLMGCESKWFIGVLSVALSFMISDGLLALTQGVPWFGSWSLFTYTALLFIVVLSRFFQPSTVLTAFVATCFYWVWTNFGVWLVSGMYAHSINGLMICFVMALPFLTNSLIGSLVWYFVIFNNHTKKILGLAQREEKVHFS